MKEFIAPPIAVIFMLSAVVFVLASTTGCEVFEQVREWGKMTSAESDSENNARSGDGERQSDSALYKDGAEKGYFQHRVRWPGESLSIIAGWYTGEFSNWKKLAEANPGIDPERIHIGDTILIPKDLMEIWGLLTLEYVQKHRKRTGGEEAHGEKAPSREQGKEPELFAPKEVPIEE